MHRQRLVERLARAMDEIDAIKGRGRNTREGNLRSYVRRDLIWFLIVGECGDGDVLPNDMEDLTRMFEPYDISNREMRLAVWQALDDLKRIDLAEVSLSRDGMSVITVPPLTELGMVAQR